MMIKRIICKLFGHKKPKPEDVKWRGIYGSFHASRHGKCPRCKKNLIMHGGILGLAGWLEDE